VGQTVTYRISTTSAAEPQTAPVVTTLAIAWKTGGKLVAHLAGSAASALIPLTRDADGRLAPSSSTTSDPDLKAALDALNRPAQLALALSGSDHAQTTLRVVPPAPAGSPSPNPVVVPITVDLVNSTEDNATLMADGTSRPLGEPGARGHRGGGGGFPGGGGGWHGGERSGREGAPNLPTIEVAEEAQFNGAGMLTQESYRETITTKSSSGTTSVERTVSIELVP
jgi:uncharacterized membrane protein YgcG